MEFPDELWKIIKDYQLDYKTMERFFDNLNSKVYSFHKRGITMDPRYVDDMEERDLYIETENDDDWDREIYCKMKLVLVTEDPVESWEIKVKFKHNGVKITETYKIPDAPYGKWSEPCYTKGESLCGNYICKVESYKVPYYPRRCMASGSVSLRIKKKYYTKNKSTNKRYLENTILETKRVRKKPKNFKPNFEKPSTSSYY